MYLRVYVLFILERPKNRYFPIDPCVGKQPAEQYSNTWHLIRNECGS